MPVSFRDWLAQSRDDLQSDPVRGSLHILYTVYLSAWFSLTSRYPIGTNVYDEEWDLLIVLDGCRTDLLREVADEYSFLGPVQTRWSVGSHSREWLTNTFTESYRSEIEKTVMVTGNPHTDTVFRERTFPPKETIPGASLRWSTVEESAFQNVRSLWKTHQEEGLGVPPRPLTDRAIHDGRASDPDRMVVHYMQPHLPYIADAIDGDGKLTIAEEKGWRALEHQEADLGEVWSAYRDNLRLVLDEVELLLDNYPAENVCITADHGNAFGEFGAYGHPEGFPHPVVKNVPWLTTSATDSGSYEPIIENEEEISENVENVLGDLGYL